MLPIVRNHNSIKYHPRSSSTMDSNRIKDICVRSCIAYRSFVEEQQAKGEHASRFVLDIDVMEFDKSGEVILRISQNVRSVNDMFLMIGKSAFYTDDIRDLIYDRDRNIISMYPTERVLELLKSTHVSEVKLVSDLKWLIDITQNFYESYGHMVRYPDRLTNLYGREEFHTPKGREPSPQQMDAIEGVLNDPTSYVWGTPGTGKTQFVLSTAIMTCVREGERVAVIAPTNTALEQVLRGLIRSLKESDPDGEIVDIDRDILRLGTASQQFAKEFPHICENRSVSKELEVRRSEIRQLESDLREARDPKEWDRIAASIRYAKDRIKRFEDLDPELKERRVRIIAMTPQRLMMRYSPDGSDRPSLNVDRIFLDEAGYTSLINTLPLFSFGVPVSLLGDHMQLPPVCEISHDIIKAGLISDDDEGLCYTWYLSSLYAESMLHLSDDAMARIAMGPTQYTFFNTKQYDLSVSYRFGERLAKLLDSYVYGNIGLTGMSDDELELEVIDVEFTDRMVRNNLAECEAIAKDIMEKGLEAKDFAILTPYRAQVAMMVDVMGDRYRRRFDISTVHRSQGREWDTVYFTVVDNSKRLGKELEYHLTSNLQLPSNLTTINTAISRAKKRLVIVCDAEFWKSRKGDLIGELVSKADKVSYFRHDDSDPIRFSEKGSPERECQSVKRYHNRVDERVPKRIYAAFKNGDINVTYNTVNIVYDYCKRTMVTDAEMGAVDHIIKAYDLIRSRDYEYAEDELRAMMDIHNSLGY